MQILVTGGTGYIGSHAVIELIAEGHDVVVVDNFSNSSHRSLAALRNVANRDIAFCQGDVRDAVCLDRMFERHTFDAVMHFAGVKAVGESVDLPMKYYDNNVNGTLRLLECMRAHSVNTFVFSSSCTVYGEPALVPVAEDCPTGAVNPYGRSKLTVEHILRDLCAAEPGWRVSVLRYFNPIGAHGSGELGEDPQGVPNNLLPYISQVAVGRMPHVNVYGNDYPTRDGTGVRDYIHVVDLARGHLKALEFLQNAQGLTVHNLGTGRGHSVLEVIAAFEAASGRPIPYQVVPRRPGDAAEVYADPARARAELGWVARYDIDRMCADAWRWQSTHPQGFAG